MQWRYNGWGFELWEKLTCNSGAASRSKKKKNKKKGTGGGEAKEDIATVNGNHGQRETDERDEEDDNEEKNVCYRLRFPLLHPKIVPKRVNVDTFLE